MWGGDQGDQEEGGRVPDLDVVVGDEVDLHPVSERPQQPGLGIPEIYFIVRDWF